MTTLIGEHYQQYHVKVVCRY